MEWLRAVGPSQAVDVDQAALRVTLDVIGLVGQREAGREEGEPAAGLGGSRCFSDFFYGSGCFSDYLRQEEKR